MFNKSKSVLISVLVMAAILPVLLAGMLSGESFRLTSRASSDTDLRLWLEPSSITAKVGQQFYLKIMGSYESTSKVIPQIKLSIKSDSKFVISKPDLSITDGLSGKRVLGTIQVSPTSTGKGMVWIDEGTINTGIPNLTVTSSGSEITIRE